jgi:hypothetical protein
MGSAYRRGRKQSVNTRAQPRLGATYGFDNLASGAATEVGRKPGNTKTRLVSIDLVI